MPRLVLFRMACLQPSILPSTSWIKPLRLAKVHLLLLLIVIFIASRVGLKCLSSAKIKVGKHGYYFSDFSLTTGHIGKLNLDYAVEAEEHAVVELTSRIFGHANDSINMSEKVSLNGRFSHSVIKSRVALEG